MKINRVAGQETHADQKNLKNDLAHFADALDCLSSSSDVFENLDAAEQVIYHGRRLADHLCGQFACKEEAELATIARISPELAEVAQNLRREHEELCTRLATFSRAVEQLAVAEDLSEAICPIKEQGKALVQQIGRHLALEESELARFL